MNYLFYFFAIPLVIMSWLVIASKNPVHSVLFLILVFINSAALFLLLNAEFIAMILVIVYVGAVAVLFLFIVVMLGVDEIKQKLSKNVLMLSIIVASILFYELSGVYLTYDLYASQAHTIDTYVIGRLLYTDYFYVFQISGLILLVAMVGAIVLTLHHRQFVRKQNIVRQLSRSSAIKKVKKCS